ncbi:MAG: orotidine 5'-phosphate decarboxylase [Thermoproteota archaeon]
MRSFSMWMKELRESKNTPIVLSLDPPSGTRKPIRKLMEVVRETYKFICAVKIGRQLTTEKGFGRELLNLMEYSHSKNIPIIYDGKLNDVAYTNLVVLKKHLQLGTDAEIVSPFPGWEGGLDVIFRESKKRGKGILVLAYMSHPGARDIFELEILRPRMKLYEYIAKKAKAWEADGVVVPATRPTIIRKISSIIDLPPYAVGIGPQGGEIREAIRAGAEYLIIGRAIISSHDPGSAAERIANVAVKYEG